MPWKPSQPAMKSQRTSSAEPRAPIRDPRMVTVEVPHGDVGDLEMDDAAIGEASRDDVLHRFLLAIDGDLLAAGQRGEVDAMAASLEADLDAGMNLPLAPHSLAEAGLVEQVDAALLEYAGAHAVLDIVAAAVLQDDRRDPLPRQEVRKKQSGRPRADDANLRAFDHLVAAQNG